MSTFIRSQIDVLDSMEHGDIENEGEAPLPVNEAPNKRPQLLPSNDKFKLGAQQMPCTLAILEETHKADAAFRDFRKRLVLYLNNFFRVYEIATPGGKYIQLPTEQQVINEAILF